MSAAPAIALTGATGFVGQAVLDEAARQGVPVRALTRRPQPPREGVAWIEGSLDDAASLARLCEGAHEVIHVAGLTNALDPAEFVRANVAGTEALLGASATAGIERFVFTSSLSAREPALSAYGASKAVAEEVVAASDRAWTIVRPPAVYGPRDRDMFELFRSAKWGLVPLPPQGSTSIIHVDDLARLLLALRRRVPAVLRRTFEPDDARAGGWTHRALAEAIGKAMGRRVLSPHLSPRTLRLAARADRLLRGAGAKLTADRVGYMTHPDWVVSAGRMVPAEIWQPLIGGEEGLAGTARWYRQQGWL